MRNFDGASDYELLNTFLDQTDPDAKSAFNSFYNRHSSYMFNLAQGFGYSKYPRQAKEVSQDIFGNAIEKFLKNVHKFRQTPALNPDKQKKHVRTWLYRILEREFFDYLKKHDPGVSEIEELSETIHLKPEVEKDTVTVRQKEITKLEAIYVEAKKLSAKEQDILSQYTRYGTFDVNESWVLPPDILSALAAKYEVQPNSIQKIKQRIIEKIKQGITY
jgi:RNA polymerase sigma factor (sigma-70 family)